MRSISASTILHDYYLRLSRGFGSRNFRDKSTCSPRIDDMMKEPRTIHSQNILSMSVVALASLIFITPTQALEFTIDPGDVGDAITNPFDRFFIETPLPVPLDLIFVANKYVKYNSWGFKLTVLQEDVVPAPWTLGYLYYLTDESGSEIAGTRNELPGFTGDLDLHKDSILSNTDFSLDSITAHGFHIEVNGSLASNYRSRLQITGDGVVGEWKIPEPGTIGLLCIGVAGIGSIRKRNKKGHCNWD